MFSLRKCRPIAIVLAGLVANSSLAGPPSVERNGIKRGINGNGAGPNAANQNLVTKFKGKLKTFRQGILLITREDGVEVMVQLPKDISKFQFVATAQPEFLRQGMMVRFGGTFDKSGVAQSPISRVELFQPVAGKMTGRQRQQYLPGVYPDQRDAAKQNRTGIAKCDVVGSLVGIDQSGVMMVRAGQRAVRIPLVPSATFKIRYNNLSLAQIGDSVNVAGFYDAPDDTKVWADSVMIRTDRVYGQPIVDDSKRKRPKRRNRRRSKGKEVESKNETEAETENETSPEESKKDRR